MEKKSKLKSRQAPISDQQKKKVKRNFTAILIFCACVLPFMAYVYFFTPGAEKEMGLLIVKITMGSFFVFLLIYMLRTYYKATISKEVTIFSGFLFEKSKYANVISNGKINSTNPVTFRLLLEDRFFFVDAFLYGKVKEGDYIELTCVSKDHILDVKKIEHPQNYEL